MPKRVPVSPEARAWLQEAVARNVSIGAIADHLGCCVDTAKRILVRQGLAQFSGAKYVVSRTSEEATWTRPCMKCRSIKPRAKWQYFCTPCGVALGLHSPADPVRRKAS